MQIMIEIPDEVYERFGYEYSEENLISKHTNDIILDAFCNGTPLPKGHGILKDVDTIKKLYPLEKDGLDLRYGNQCIHTALDNAPTIIEADKESEI